MMCSRPITEEFRQLDAAHEWPLSVDPRKGGGRPQASWTPVRPRASTYDSVDLGVGGVDSLGQSVDLSSDPGTFFISTNPSIATVSDVGLVTGVGVGQVVITAHSDGLAATALVRVTSSGDQDGDGLPD